MKFDTINF